MFVEKGADFLPNLSLKKLEKFYEKEENAESKMRLQCASLRKKARILNLLQKLQGSLKQP